MTEFPHKKASRVSIVGFCANTRHLAPYDAPDMEIWGLNKGYLFMPRADRWFETHGPAIYRWEIRRPFKHIEWLKAFAGPIYMHEVDPELPNTVAYPLLEVSQDVMRGVWRIPMIGPGAPATVNAEGQVVLQEMTGNPYLTSTIAYQIALAIHEQFAEIHIYGVDLNTDGEYAWQKDGVEFLIGVAAARGIRVVIPDDAALLRGKLYGRGFKQPEGEKLSVSQFEVRAKALKQALERAAIEYHQMAGRKAELELIIQEMPPGLNAEKLSDELKQRSAALAQLEASVRQTEGKLTEVSYWISMTPEGQDGRQAIAQLTAPAETETETDHSQNGVAQEAMAVA